MLDLVRLVYSKTRGLQVLSGQAQTPESCSSSSRAAVQPLRPNSFTRPVFGQTVHSRPVSPSPSLRDRLRVANSRLAPNFLFSNNLPNGQNSEANTRPHSRQTWRSGSRAPLSVGKFRPRPPLPQPDGALNFCSGFEGVRKRGILQFAAIPRETTQIRGPFSFRLAGKLVCRRLIIHACVQLQLQLVAPGRVNVLNPASGCFEAVPCENAGLGHWGVSQCLRRFNRQLRVSFSQRARRAPPLFLDNDRIAIRYCILVIQHIDCLNALRVGLRFKSILTFSTLASRSSSRSRTCVRNGGCSVCFSSWWATSSTRWLSDTRRSPSSPHWGLWLSLPIHCNPFLLLLLFHHHRHIIIIMIIMMIIIIIMSSSSSSSRFLSRVHDLSVVHWHVLYWMLLLQKSAAFVRDCLFVLCTEPFPSGQIFESTTCHEYAV